MIVGADKVYSKNKRIPTQAQGECPVERAVHTWNPGGMERVMGIEPTLVAWEATVLPLNYTRLILGVQEFTE